MLKLQVYVQAWKQEISGLWWTKLEEALNARELLSNLRRKSFKKILTIRFPIDGSIFSEAVLSTEE